MASPQDLKNITEGRAVVRDDISNEREDVLETSEERALPRRSKRILEKTLKQMNKIEPRVILKQRQSAEKTTLKRKYTKANKKKKPVTSARTTAGTKESKRYLGELEENDLELDSSSTSKKSNGRGRSQKCGQQKVQKGPATEEKKKKKKNEKRNETTIAALGVGSSNARQSDDSEQDNSNVNNSDIDETTSESAYDFHGINLARRRPNWSRSSSIDDEDGSSMSTIV